MAVKKISVPVKWETQGDENEPPNVYWVSDKYDGPYAGYFPSEAQAQAYEKYQDKPDQVPGLKQAAERMTGRAYPEYVAGAGEYDPPVASGRYYVQTWDGEEARNTFVDPKYVSITKGPEYYDEYTGRYERPDIYVSSGQSVIDQAMNDPITWVAQNVDWGGLGQGGDFGALDTQMKFLKDNKYDLSSLYNPGAVNQYNLTRQILDQGTTGKWSGQGYGQSERDPAEAAVANAKVMAGMLANTGITDIKQFGKFNGVVGRQLHNVTLKDPSDPSKGYVYQEIAGDEFTGRTLDVPKDVQVRDVQIGYTPEDSYILKQADIPVYGETYGNKVTKQPFVDAQNYNRAYGDIFSGTYIGEDRTGFGVQFAADGTPYFYTQKGESTSSRGDIMPIVSMGMAIFAPGIGTAIGTALGATGVAASVIGGAIVQGTMAELSGGDFKDGAIAGAVGAGVAPLVSNTIGSAVAEAMGDSAFKKIVTNAVTSASTAAVTAGITGKGDVGDAALNAAVASIGGTVGKEFGGNTGAIIGSSLGKLALGQDANQVLVSAVTSALSNVAKDIKQKNALLNTSSAAVGQGEVDAIKQYLADTDALLGGAEETAAGDAVSAPTGSLPVSVLPGAALPGTGGALSDNSVDDPLLGLSSAEVGQGETNTIAGTDDASVSTGPMGPQTEDQIRRAKDEFGRYLDWLKAGEPDAPNYNVRDDNVTDENFKSFDENLKQMLDEGRLPTQWQPNDNGTFTYTGDDGDTLTINPDGSVAGYTEAPQGNLLSDATANTANTAITITGGGSPTPDPTTNPQPVTRAPQASATDTTQGALPIALSPSLLQAAPVTQGEFSAMPDLQQLFPQLTNIDPRLMQVLSNRNPKPGYYNYGQQVNAQSPLLGASISGLPSAGIPVRATSNAYSPLGAGVATGNTNSLISGGMNLLGGGALSGYAAGGGVEGHNPQFITGKTGHYVRGEGDGQSDSIPAMLADGEYVFDADTVAALGNGSNEAGARALDKMRENIRKHKRSAKHGDIPPPAKSPLAYMKG